MYSVCGAFSTPLLPVNIYRYVIISGSLYVHLFDKKRQLLFNHYIKFIFIVFSWCI